MEISHFSEKLNKVDGKIYVIEEEIQMPENGVYEAYLRHDNINEVTLTVYTGSKLTGDQIQSFALSTPSMMPWKRSIRIQTEEPVVYICYETDGDTVEAEDVNLLQGALVRTQSALNQEEGRAEEEEEKLARRIREEEERAAEAERQLSEELRKETERAKEEETAIRKDIEANRPNWDDAYEKRHVHTNKTVLDIITQPSVDKWDTVSDKVDKEEGKALSANDFTDELLEKLNGIADGANKYVHPSNAGNKHIPAGGVSGQILRWSAAGTAAWGADNNSDTKVTQKPGTANEDKRLLLSAHANDAEETSYSVKSKEFTANPVTGAFYAKGYRRIDLTGETVDVNTLNLSSGDPNLCRYINRTNGGAADITNLPVENLPFLLDVELIRWASEKDYVTMQTYRNSSNKTAEYVRFCTNGTWTAWVTRIFTDTKYAGMTGATASAAGKAGLVPAPPAGSQKKVLLGDGTWGESAEYSHPNSGVSAGTYRSVTVDAQGHVTKGTNPTTLSGYGITDAAAKNHNHDTSYIKKGAVTWADLGGE